MANFEDESKRLANAWMRHDEEFLSTYLKHSIQDPRINPQSILTRYVILEQLCEDDVSMTKYHELLYSAVILWIYNNVSIIGDPYERASLLSALEAGADATESICIPSFVKQAWRTVINFDNEEVSPNYLEKILRAAPEPDNRQKKMLFSPDDEKRPFEIDEGVLNVFLDLWKRFLPRIKTRRLSVLEPACGAANDYSVLDYMGLSNYIDYWGFDICEKNVNIARNKFKCANITIGNLYQEDLKKKYDIIYVHDLFEHLSAEGIAFALKKLCNHCNGVLCLNFFNMEEIPEHIIRNVGLYHWNTLSRPKICELVESFGFEVQIINILAFFRETYRLEPYIATEDFYNPRAHTLICRKINVEGQVG